MSSEAIRLEVPLQAVESGVEVAVRAAELSLKSEVGIVEKLLAAAHGVTVFGSAEIDRRDNFVGALVSITAILSSMRFGDVKPLAVW